MFKHDRLAAFKWCKQMDSVQIVDGSARQNRDRQACKGVPARNASTPGTDIKSTDRSGMGMPGWTGRKVSIVEMLDHS